MEILLSSSNALISIAISGKMNEVDLSWRIQPLTKSVEKLDFDSLYKNLKKLKSWAKNKKIAIKIKASFLFKAALYFFIKSEK